MDKVLKFIVEFYAALCTIVVSVGILLIAIFGGSFKYHVNFESFSELMKQIFKK